MQALLHKLDFPEVFTNQVLEPTMYCESRQNLEDTQTVIWIKLAYLKKELREKS